MGVHLNDGVFQVFHEQGGVRILRRANRGGVQVHAEGTVHIRGDRPQRRRVGDHDAGAEPPAAGHHTLGGTDQLNAATTCGGGKLRVHRILAGAVLPRDLAHARVHADLA